MMKGGERLRRLLVSVGLIFFLIIALFPDQGYADSDSGDLIFGVPTDSGITELTDGNPDTTYTVQAGESIRWTFDQAVDLQKVTVNIIARSASIQYWYYTQTGSSWMPGYSGIGEYTSNVNQKNTKTFEIRVTGTSGSVTFAEVALFGPPPPPPPPVPTGLTATAGDRKVELHWNSVTDPDLVGYRVYQDGIRISGSTPITQTSYIVTGLENGHEYSFQVSSVGLSESAKSQPVVVTPNAPPDDIPPAIPTGLTADVYENMVSLSWDPNTESDLQGYRVYRNDSLLASTVEPSYTDANVSRGNTYVYEVSAYDIWGNESPRSAPVSVTIRDKLAVNFVPNKDSIIVQVTGGTPPYTVDWGEGSETFSASSYRIRGLQASTDYTVIVTDSNGQSVTEIVNTGEQSGYIPPMIPSPVELFQRMINIFGRAGTIAVSVIGAAVALGIITVLGIWGWRLAKRWLATAK